MNLIDTVGVNRVLKENLSLKDDYFLAPDLTDEVEMTELIHSRKTPEELRSVVELDEFNEAIYMHQYKLALNSYQKRSFYNMTGFGDVSILATIQTILDGYARQKAEQLFSTSEPIYVFTDDRKLTTVIQSTFSGLAVYVKPVSEIK